MIDTMNTILIIAMTITLVMWVTFGGASVWYEAFSRNPYWADKLREVNKILKWFVYLGGVLVLIYLLIN